MPGTKDMLDELDAFLLELNRAAADVILPVFRNAAQLSMEDKGTVGAFDPVTAADRGAEAAIRKHVAARYPDHGVLGEEYGADRVDAEWVWVVDPIDGTRAFVAGLPVWTTLIGLRHQGRPVLGSIGQPVLGEVFIGRASGSRCVTAAGERPLRVRACARLADAVIATTDPFKLLDERELAVWQRVQAGARFARYGCDAYAYAMVAAGFVDLVAESSLKPWDIDAAVPVLQGAGGMVTDWSGRDIGTAGGQMLIAGDRRLLDEVLPMTRPVARAG
ncbi:MAG: histidinol-phosphatase [Deltaproteobacteria bacterium RBG_16_71_12]|nr:MAG: histidinol-phosphatase [Deltaproteobacteria bacterium RBG_16_71_12]